MLGVTRSDPVQRESMDKTRRGLHRDLGEVRNGMLRSPRLSRAVGIRAVATANTLSWRPLPARDRACDPGVRFPDIPGVGRPISVGMSSMRIEILPEGEVVCQGSSL
jgi:hypothetical protein